MPISGIDPVAELMQRPGKWAKELAATFDLQGGVKVAVDAPTPPSGQNRWSDASASVSISDLKGPSAVVKFKTYNDAGETAQGSAAITVIYPSGNEVTSTLKKVDVPELCRLVTHLLAFNDNPVETAFVVEGTSASSMAGLQAPSAAATSNSLTERVTDWVKLPIQQSLHPLHFRAMKC